MKKIALFLGLSIATLCNAQTKLDTLLFDKVNAYRIDNGLKPVKWDISMFYVGIDHAKFCAYTLQATHDQVVPENSVARYFLTFEDFNLEPDFLQRCFNCFYQEGTYTFGENVATHIFNNGITLEEIQYYLREENLDIVANDLLLQWKMSPSHNELLLDPKIEYGAISTYVFISDLTPFNIFEHIGALSATFECYYKLDE